MHRKLPDIAELKKNPTVFLKALIKLSDPEKRAEVKDQDGLEKFLMGENATVAAQLIDAHDGQNFSLAEIVKIFPLLKAFPDVADEFFLEMLRVYIKLKVQVLENQNQAKKSDNDTLVTLHTLLIQLLKDVNLPDNLVKFSGLGNNVIAERVMRCVIKPENDLLSVSKRLIDFCKEAKELPADTNPITAIFQEMIKRIKKEPERDYTKQFVISVMNIIELLDKEKLSLEDLQEIVFRTCRAIALNSRPTFYGISKRAELLANLLGDWKDFDPAEFVKSMLRQDRTFVCFRPFSIARKMHQDFLDFKKQHEAILKVFRDPEMYEVAEAKEQDKSASLKEPLLQRSNRTVSTFDGVETHDEDDVAKVGLANGINATKKA